jgi:hypothetical protein
MELSSQQVNRIRRYLSLYEALRKQDVLSGKMLDEKGQVAWALVQYLDSLIDNIYEN